MDRFKNSENRGLERNSDEYPRYSGRQSKSIRSNLTSKEILDVPLTSNCLTPNLIENINNFESSSSTNNSDSSKGEVKRKSVIKSHIRLKASKEDDKTKSIVNLHVKKDAAMSIDTKKKRDLSKKKNKIEKHKSHRTHICLDKHTEKTVKMDDEQSNEIDSLDIIAPCVTAVTSIESVKSEHVSTEKECTSKEPVPNPTIIKDKVEVMLKSASDEIGSAKSLDAANSESNDRLEFLIDGSVSLADVLSRKETESVDAERCDSSETFCRICHELDQEEALISPCKCRGSLSRVHTSCLERWLAESDSSHCELCGFKYQTKRHPRYSMMGSVLAWFKSSRRDRRDVILDILATITLAPLAGIGTYIGLLMAEALNIEDDVQNLTIGTVTGRVAALSVISLMTTLDVAYATWAAIRLQCHVNNWYSWYRRNSVVTLLNNSNERSK